MRAPAPLPIPRLLRRNVRHKGLPVPYIALMGEDGVPDFRVVDEHKRLRTARHHSCQLCGKPIGARFYFVGGPKSMAQLAYYEPPAHLECLMYAMQACPFIAGKIEHAEVAKVAQKHAGFASVKIDPNFETLRDPAWHIVKAQGYHLVVYPNSNSWLFMPDDVELITVALHPETMTRRDWREVTKQLA